MSRTTRTNLAILATACLALAIALFAMGRPWICECGRVDWWGPVGPTQSQMLADWYSPSHLVHGFAFYWFAWAWLGPGREAPRFAAACTIEVLWEVAENTSWLIDRYREATVALGYSGDSIVNSVSDVVMMAIGYTAARRLPVWVSVALIILLELAALLAVRDNLTLNVLMLLIPNETIIEWQSHA